MPVIDSEALPAQLAKRFAPLYVIHGEEPLLGLEAADRIRARARELGYAERELLIAESGFDWGSLAAAGTSLSLFGGRKLIELRIPTGRPGTAGAEALIAYCERLPPDVVTLIELLKLERSALGSRWFEALGRSGVVVHAKPVPRERLPRWIAARLAAQGQEADAETLAFMAERVEGNLLAAFQEVQKLALLFPPGPLSFEAVRSAVLNVARYEPAQLGEALFGGDVARFARVLEGLQGEGAALPLVLWQIAEDVRAVARLQSALREGRKRDQALREARVWGARQAWAPGAAQRFDPARLDWTLQELARLDRMAKGLAPGDVWSELARLALTLAGTSAARAKTV
jgi:DNA polymerase-3 subunit delta